MVKNIQKNTATNVIPHNFAISETVGETELYSTPGHSGASTILHDHVNSSGPYTTVSLVNHGYLNTVFRSNSERYFVKIDVEGYEFEVLKALRSALFFQFIQDFFIEFDSRIGNVVAVEKFLLENHFLESRRLGKDSHWDAHLVKNNV